MGRFYNILFILILTNGSTAIMAFNTGLKETRDFNYKSQAECFEQLVVDDFEDYTTYFALDGVSGYNKERIVNAYLDHMLYECMTSGSVE